MRRRVELTGGRRRARSRVRRHRELPELARRAGTPTAKRSSRSISRPACRSGRSSRAARATTTSTSRARRTCSTPNGRALVGLGGKDGIYYALDRATGKLVWKATASRAARAVAELLDRRLHRRDRGRRRHRRRRHRDRRSVPVPARHRTTDGRDRVAAERARADVRVERDRERRRVLREHDRLHPARRRPARRARCCGRSSSAGGIAGGVAVTRRPSWSRSRAFGSRASTRPAPTPASTRSSPGRRARPRRPRRRRERCRPPPVAPPPTAPRSERAAGPEVHRRSRARSTFTLKAPPAGNEPDDDDPPATRSRSASRCAPTVSATRTRGCARTHPPRRRARSPTACSRPTTRSRARCCACSTRTSTASTRSRHANPRPQLQPHQHPRDRQHARAAVGIGRVSTGSSRPISLDQPVSFK